MPHNIRLFSDVGAKMSMFDNKAKMHKENQMINPFSDWDGSGTRRKLSRDDPDYGKPLEGSKTAERGKKAQLEMISDMVELCDVIFDCGVRSPDGRGAICFGDVFRLYSQINDKCVGLLMRGRKHNILDFEGEMLFQRRDDDKMIELLLPLNTIRYKYGMPERPGCGEVRPDLLEELEQQLRDKQPARCRSMEQLGLPPPPLHKSRSCELPRNAAGGGDANWRLTPEPAGRRSSEDALEQIGEDEGAVGGVVFTAMPEAAASDTGQKEEADGETESAAEEAGSQGDAVAVPVKFAVGDDDEDSVSKSEDTAEKKPDATQVTEPPVWPEVTIVVGDEDAENKATEKHEEAKNFNGDQTQSDSEHMENENIQIKISDMYEKASTSDIASLAPDSESDFDFWGSTEQDSCGGGEESTDKSAMETPRSESPARRLSSELVEAVSEAEGDVATEDAPGAEEAAEETEVNSANQQPDEPSPEDQQEEEKASSSENVSNEIKDAPEDGTQPTDKEEPKIDNADKKSGSFSFWDDEDEKETSEKVPSAVESERRNSENTNVNSESADPDDPKQVENGEVDQGESNTPDATETAADVAATTNGETFSFWDDTEEEDPAPTRRKSETCVLKDESRVRTPTVSESDRVPSSANGEWEATSAERPAGGDGGPATALSPPALSVPHLTLSDESEPMPAR